MLWKIYWFASSPVESPLFNFYCMAILYLLDESLYIYMYRLIFDGSGSVEGGYKLNFFF